MPNNNASKPSRQRASSSKGKIVEFRLRGAQKLHPPDGWPTLHRNAYHGLAGEFVTTVAPHCEGCEPALLVTLLIMFGNSIGGKAHFMVGETPHYTNDFAVLVGTTADARKGTTQDQVEATMRATVSEDVLKWRTRIVGGLSSGEGLINLVRDLKPSEIEAGEEEPDRRLMVIEREFASLLTVMQRHGNNISTHVRNAWDHKPLGTQTKSPLTATNAHISIIGHATIGDLKRQVTNVEIANGFVNRFMIVLAYRAWVLPFPEQPHGDLMRRLGAKLRKAHGFGIKSGRMHMSDDADDLWEKMYPKLGRSDGLFGNATNRASGHILRLAMIYALLDRQCLIEAVHLRAAKAVWNYCERGTRIVIGDLLGDPVADTILAELKKGDLNRTQIRDLFDRNKPKTQIDNALELLRQNELATCYLEKTGGRKREVWSIDTRWQA